MDKCLFELMSAIIEFKGGENWGDFMMRRI